MPNKDQLLKELDWITEKISSQVWTLNLGTLGTTWSLLITATLPNNVRFTAANALPIVVLCIISLLCELGQYLSAYIMLNQIRTSMETSKLTVFQYDETSGLWQSRMIFFWLKIIGVTLAAAILVITLIIKFT